MNSDNQRKFLVDGMLGNIAKKLRLFGYDTKYSASESDEALVKIIQDENRILITKDGELSGKTKKLDLETIFLSGNNELENFLEIKNKLGIDNFSIQGKNTRCTSCNGELTDMEKNQIIDQIPPNVAKNETFFWKCTSCGKIYWEGTHILHLQNLVSRLNE